MSEEGCLLRLRRSVAKEKPSDPSTWDRASLIPSYRDAGHNSGSAEGCTEGAGRTFHRGADRVAPMWVDREAPAADAPSAGNPTGNAGIISGGGGRVGGAGAVLVLPYCFFRSRGCPHLAKRFDDRVIFHHEFDTDWRPAFWHNYFDPQPAARHDGQR